MFLCFIGIAVAGAIGLGFYAWREIGQRPSAEEMRQYEKLPYFKDGKFQSPQKMILQPDKVRNGPAGFSRMLLPSKFAPEVQLPQVSLTKDSFASSPSDYALYWLGHSAVVLELAGSRIIFDPVLGNAAPIPFAVPRYGNAPITREELPETDYVIITHNHYDHLERKTVQALKKAHFIVPLGVGAALRGWGIPAENITELGWGDVFENGKIKITAETAQHYSGRAKLASNETLWNSYIITAAGKNIYWSGDSGYGAHFKQIGDKYGPFDFASLEIDAWNPGWPNIHLFPEEAVKAAQDLNTKQILPLHWAVFDLALHPWHESVDMLIDNAAKTNIKIMTPKMGERINPDAFDSQKWW